MSDAPTQSFDKPTPPSGSRGARIALIAIGAALLLAIIIILILLFGRFGGSNTAATGTPTPTASSASPTPTPTVTASASASPSASASASSAPPPPPNPNAQITTFTISPSVVDCTANAPANAADLSIRWSTQKAEYVYFGVTTQDAQYNGMGWTTLPVIGTQHDFPSGYDPYTYQCGNTTEPFTITAVGSNGSRVSKTIIVKSKH